MAVDEVGTIIVFRINNIFCATCVITVVFHVATEELVDGVPMFFRAIEKSRIPSLILIDDP